MTDHPSTLARYRLPLDRDHLKQARDLAEDQWRHARHLAAPAVRYGRSNPALLIGAGILALVSIVAFTNRKTIAAKAGPMLEKAGPLLEDAKAKGQALLDEAATRGQDLVSEAKTRGSAVIEEARTRGGAVIEKVSQARKDAAGRLRPADVN